MINSLRALFKPDMFQGWGKTKNYFEGWYFKIISKNKENALAIIPGIAYDNKGEGHSFIQILDGKVMTSEYHKFKLVDFKASSKRFDIWIGNNHFTNSGLQMDLPKLSGELLFENNVPWPNSWYSPGIMGPYSFAPFMECYHGIVSMNHIIKGKLTINEKTVDFDKGKGYIEKDWGKSFPKAYIWMQSNHFNKPNTSIKFSLAQIPWIKKAFNGFIAGLWYNNNLIQFTTYNKSRLLQCALKDNILKVELTNKSYRLQLEIISDHASTLISPINGSMKGKIEESMYSKMQIKLFELKTNSLIYSDYSENVCLEMAGELELILIQ